VKQPPNLELPIEDRHAAEWWRDHFAEQFIETNDFAFKEARDTTTDFIDRYFDEEDDE
jgi:hypothetical protein